MKVSAILDQIDLNAIALPVFQRGYVWNREQVRALMRSLYRRYPIGSLLVWVTDPGKAGGADEKIAGPVRLLLDGQQRVTTLYGIIRGKPPAFFNGNPSAFTGLHFHLEDEVFEFYAPMKMKGDPLWVDVTRLMQHGLAEALGPFLGKPEAGRYLERLNRIVQIKDVDLHVEEVTGEDKTTAVVVDIFNQVNSGGTKLSEGDLALAKMCVDWPEAKQRIHERIEYWGRAGFRFRPEWLLRNVTAILTGQASFSGLRTQGPDRLEAGLAQAERAINYVLNLVSARLGLDHDRVLGGAYAFPVMTRYVVQQAFHLGAGDQGKLLYWYVHSFLWGRFAGAVETVLNQDLAAIRDGGPGALDRLIEQLRLWRGDLRVRHEDFGGSTLGARFYPMLYLLTRVGGARDWGTGVALSANLLGKQNALQVHHIFPKALLKKHGYARAEVNAIANFCFLTQTSNLEIESSAPERYFEEVERQFPGALASQWIPMDRALWRVERYRDFLAARRELLARAANNFLERLLATESMAAAGPVTEPVRQTVAGTPKTSPAGTATLRRMDVGGALAEGVPVGVQPVQDESVRELLEWVDAHGVPRPETDYEIVDPRTGEVAGAVDVAWPEGVQAGRSEPVALVLEADEALRAALERLGVRCFERVESLKDYLTRQLALT